MTGFKEPNSWLFLLLAHNTSGENFCRTFLSYKFPLFKEVTVTNEPSPVRLQPAWKISPHGLVRWFHPDSLFSSIMRFRCVAMKCWRNIHIRDNFDAAQLSVRRHHYVQICAKYWHSLQHWLEFVSTSNEQTLGCFLVTEDPSLVDQILQR